MYDVDYFIQKFKAIPEEMWCEGDFNGSEEGVHCAYGHCGMNWWTSFNNNPEAKALNQLAGHINLADVNDGALSEYRQATPKQRVLAFLRGLKANQ